VTDRPTDQPALANTNASQKPDPHADRVQATHKLPADTCDALRLLFCQILKIRALVVGDGIQDCYHEIELQRENPEAPGSFVYNFVRSAQSPGGAAAVAAMVQSLQAPYSPQLIQAIGAHWPLKTRFGRGYLPGRKKPDRLEPPQCVMRQDRPLREIDRVTNTYGTLSKLDRSGITGAGWIPRAGDDPRPPDVIIISDYAQGVVERPLMDHLCDYLRSQLDRALADGRDPATALPVVVIDPRRAELINQVLIDKYRWLADFDDSESRIGMGGAWLWMTPNQPEAEKLLGLNPGKWGHLPTMLCTDGANPVRAMVGWKPGPLEFPPIRQFRPIDPCGCGDQFAATFGLALAAIRSWPPSESPVSSSPLGGLPLAIQFAQLVAGLQTQRIGATPIRAVELMDEINRVEED
jgi:hypothetical protein